MLSGISFCTFDLDCAVDWLWISDIHKQKSFTLFDSNIKQTFRFDVNIGNGEDTN